MPRVVMTSLGVTVPTSAKDASWANFSFSTDVKDTSTFRAASDALWDILCPVIRRRELQRLLEQSSNALSLGTLRPQTFQDSETAVFHSPKASK